MNVPLEHYSIYEGHSKTAGLDHLIIFVRYWIDNQGRNRIKGHVPHNLSDDFELGVFIRNVRSVVYSVPHNFTSVMTYAKYGTYHG